MAQPLRLEDPEATFFITTRTMNSRLWFVNNPCLEEMTLGYLAKYQDIFDVVIHAFIIMGNHYHLIAQFPRANKAAFMQAFNSMFARLVGRHVKKFEGGTCFGRRYADQCLPDEQDIEHWSYYIALNPVHSGLCQKISEFPGYNSFSDAISGRKLTFKVFNRAKYNDKKRFNDNVKKLDYWEKYTLTYTRLPGYEDMHQSVYKKMMLKKLEERRIALIKERLARGLGFTTIRTLRETCPGARPHNTKKSERNSYRPLVLSVCPKAREKFLDMYFKLCEIYQEASERYRNGDENAIFPPGTYKPPCFCALVPT